MVLPGLAVGLANRAWKSKGNWLKPRALPPLQYGSVRQRGILWNVVLKDFNHETFTQNHETVLRYVHTIVHFNIVVGFFYVKSTTDTIFFCIS